MAYPLDLDSIYNSHLWTDARTDHAQLHNQIANSIMAIQAKLWIDGSTLNTTVDYLLTKWVSPWHHHIAWEIDDFNWQVNIIINTALESVLTDISNISGSLSSHIANLNNPHSTTKAQVWLSDVDNTSDANKPISTATQNALNLKADQLTTYTKLEVDALIPDISWKVDKAPWKWLSTEDYTTAEKNKLSGIEAWAEVNIQADWNEVNNISDAFIKNKPTIIPAAQIQSDWNQSNNALSDYIKNKPAIPTKVSDLTNDLYFISDAPVDWKQYARKDWAWAEVVSSGWWAVASVNGKVWIVILTTWDISEATDKNYVTDAQKLAITHSNRTNLDLIDQNLSQSAMPKFVWVEIDTAYTPTGLEPIGSAFWDTLTETWVIRTSTDTYLNLWAEISPLLKSWDTFDHLNWQPVYISSWTWKLPVVQLAGAAAENTSYAIYLATQDVAHTWNARWRYTQIGTVNWVPYQNVIATTDDYALWAEWTMLYLSTEVGKLTMTRPTAPNHWVTIWQICDKSWGNISINCNIRVWYELDELHDVDMNKAKTTPVDADVMLLRDSADSSIWKKLTWGNAKSTFKTYFDWLYWTIAQVLGRKVFHWVTERATQAPLPTHLTTTTFTLSTNTTPMTYWRNGVQTVVNTQKTTTLAWAAWLYHIYFNDDAWTLVNSTVFPWIDSTDTTNVFIATVYWNGSNYWIVNDERHRHSRSWEWHDWTHSTIGCRYRSWLDFSFAWTTTANTTFSISSWEIRDEDIKFAISTQTQCRLWQQTWANTYWFSTTLSTTPYSFNGTWPTAVRSDTYATVAINNSNRYFNYFVYATTSWLAPIHVFTETVSPANVGWYTSVANARAIPFPSLAWLWLSPEWKPIYRVIVNGAGLIQTMTAADDYRSVSTISWWVIPSSTASSVSETNYWNVQTAINTLIAADAALVSDTAYDATTWDWVTTIAPSKNAIRDKIESILTTITWIVPWRLFDRTYVSWQLSSNTIDYQVAHAAWSITWVKATLLSLPTWASITIQICKNGTASTNSIFTSDTPLTIATNQGATNWVYTVTDTAIDNWSFAADDVMYVIVSVSWTTLPWSYLSIVYY